MPPEIQIQQQIDVERLHERLRGMTDEQLLHFGKSSRYMTSRYANMGKAPLQAFVIQLEEEARPIHPSKALRWQDR